MSQPAPRRRRRSLAKWLVPSNNVYVVLHILLISLVYVGFFFVVVDSLKVYSDYKSFARDVLNAQNITTCPTVCSFNLTSQWRDPRAVIVIDNPSGTPVLLSLYTMQHNGMWVATVRTTQINVTFDGGLYVDVYPLYPLSDAAPRSAYLPGNGNLTIRTTPPAIGGAIQPLQAIIGTVIGLLTTLGIIQHVTKTPAVNAMGSTFPAYMKAFTYPFLVLFLLFLLVLLKPALVQMLACNPSQFYYMLGITSLFLSLAFSMFLCKIRFIRCQRNLKDVTTLVIIIVLTFLGLVFIFKNNPPSPHQLYSTALFLIFVNPISLFYLKSLATDSRVRRAIKVGLLHLYDLAVLIWFLQWLVNPYPTIFKPAFIELSFLQIILIVLLVIFGFIIVFRASLHPLIFLYSIIPFIFNEEFAARVELCRRALNQPTKVRIYPEKGKSVVGFVVECDAGKIAVSNYRRTRVFSWGDVQQIEIL